MGMGWRQKMIWRRWPGRLVLIIHSPSHAPYSILDKLSVCGQASSPMLGCIQVIEFTSTHACFLACTHAHTPAHTRTHTRMHARAGAPTQALTQGSRCMLIICRASADCKHDGGRVCSEKTTTMFAAPCWNPPWRSCVQSSPCRRTRLTTSLTSGRSSRILICSKSQCTAGDFCHSQKPERPRNPLRHSDPGSSRGCSKRLSRPPFCDESTFCDDSTFCDVSTFFDVSTFCDVSTSFSYYLLDTLWALGTPMLPWCEEDMDVPLY